MAHMTPEYRKKYVHSFPDTEVVSRSKFICGKCLDKIVVDIGCGNNVHITIQEVAKKAYGIDRDDCNTKNFHKCDITDIESLKKLVFSDVELILMCDIIEHLSNPGMFLDTVKEMYPMVDKVVSAPNFQAGFFRDYIKLGYENVNPEHVAYYSYNTLKNLLVRHKYEIKEFYWYENSANYPQGLNEGVLFIAT